MNIFWIVVLAVGVLLVAALFMRRQEPTAVSKPQPNPAPTKPSGKPVQKLPPEEARKWLDDFLVKQQDKKDAV